MLDRVKDFVASKAFVLVEAFVRTVPDLRIYLTSLRDRPCVPPRPAALGPSWQSLLESSPFLRDARELQPQGFSS